jgi:hypothetical protein
MADRARLQFMGQSMDPNTAAHDPAFYTIQNTPPHLYLWWQGRAFNLAERSKRLVSSAFTKNRQN